MQVILCELVGNFSFAPPAGEAFNVRLASTLMPTLSDGGKGALLRIAPIS
jgi:hypothetical protein